MKGVWLLKSECCNALKCNFKSFDCVWARKLTFRIDGSRKRFFLPADMMPKESQKAYADMWEERDDDSDQVESILGNISSGPVDDLTAARLDNLKARTAVLQEKLEARKEELWQEWNGAFFEVFTEAFAKFKNDLISLHLNEEQLKTLNEKLENALKIMADKLDAMYNNFNNENEEEQ